jgi:hypothetical protein
MRIAAILCVLALVTGCGATNDRHEATLVDVHSVLPLRAAFEADRGSPRLLVVLSPT